MKLSEKFDPGQIVDDMVLCLACSQKLIDPLVQQLEKLPAACWGKTGFDQACCTTYLQQTADLLKLVNNVGRPKLTQYIFSQLTSQQ